LTWLDAWLNTLGWSNSGEFGHLKIWKHGGFVLESIKALLQSILQFVALLCYKHVTPMSTYSIFSSVLSIVMRGVMFSHSLNRPTFIFNVACFAADIFNTFSCLSWAFWDTGIVFPWKDNSWQFTVHDVYGQIWLNQMFCMTLILGSIIALILGFFLAGEFVHIGRLGIWNCPMGNNRNNSCISQWLETIFLLLVIVPVCFSMRIICFCICVAAVTMVCQMFKLWTWCFAFTVFEAKYMADNEFFRPWLN